jgi:oligo-1,6-glucosidase
LRKTLPELVYGKYELLDRNNPRVYAYTRSLGTQKLLVLLNFSAIKTNFMVADAVGKPGRALINNLSELSFNKTDKGNDFILRPYQAVIVKLN